jgi:TolB protein
MQHFLRLFCLLSLAAAPALAQRNLGTVEVAVDSSVILVRVSSSVPELNDLALRAFATHGRYRLVASGFNYDIRFTPAGANQVRVDILKGVGVATYASETATGASLRQALLRAADFAVEKTNGLGLRGYFTARLAFIRDLGRAKEVCTSDLFFSSGEVRQVTHFNSQSLAPRWSPDGARILYTSYFKGFPDIYQLDLAGNQQTAIASFKGSNYGARFSPTGRQIAMIITGEGAPDIYVTDASGRVTAGSRRTRSDAAKGSPCWSPDGGRLVFSMQPGPQLYLMPAGGGGVQRLGVGYSYADEPDWSRAAPNKIACTVRTGGRYQIAVYDFSKGKAEIVSKAPFDGVEPCWLADGRHLVYTARNASESRLCILDTESGKSTPISPASFGSALQGSVWTP